MLGPAFALGSSLTYGLSDFLGGTTSRRIGTLQFMFCAQLIGAVLAAGWVAFSADPVPPVKAVAAAAGAGLGITVGLMAFFQAMVVGKMSVVAPVSATGVALPVAVGILGGEHPSAAQAIGIVAASVGVVFSARSPAPQRAASAEAGLGSAESGLGLALLSAVGTGVFLWLMAPASRHGVAWALLVARALPVVVLTAAVSIRRMSIRPALEPRTASVILVQSLLAFIGVTLYAFATLHSQLAIVSVLGSLYPAVIVLLAYWVLGERLAGAQQLAVLAVLTGVVLLSL